jgi:hypothetical protein
VSAKAPSAVEPTDTKPAVDVGLDVKRETADRPLKRKRPARSDMPTHGSASRPFCIDDEESVSAGALALGDRRRGENRKEDEEGRGLIGRTVK